MERLLHEIEQRELPELMRMQNGKIVQNQEEKMNGNQKWFSSGEKLIQNMRDQETLSNTIAIWRIGQCGVFMKYAGKIILVDPVLEPIKSADGVCRTNFAPPFSADANFDVDAVFCTHNHLDHFQPDTICKLAESHPKVQFFVPAGILDEIADTIAPFSNRVIGLRQAQQFEVFSDISVTAVAVPHDVYRTDSVGNEKALGYWFSMGKATIFHCGDAVATERLVTDIRALGSVNLAFLPINGRDWVRESKNIIGNMTPQEAALFATKIDCQTVIPTHYDMMRGNEENPLIFAYYMEQMQTNCAWHLLRLGEPYLYTY